MEGLNAHRRNRKADRVTSECGVSVTTFNRKWSLIYSVDGSRESVENEFGTAEEGLKGRKHVFDEEMEVRVKPQAQKK